MKQIRYTSEQRQAAAEQMGPAHLRPIKVLAKATGITDVTLRTWRREAIEVGQLLRRDPRQSHRWSRSVNGNWRVTFRFVSPDEELVDYQDYH